MKFVTKTIALTLTTAIISTSLLPVNAAFSHDKRKWHKHHGHKHHAVRKHRKRSSKGEKIAAGIIGFAIGAIIASEAAKKSQPVYQPSYHQPQPIYREPVVTYHTPSYRDDYVERRSINDYNRTPIIDDAPRVITYEEEVTQRSYEPWSPGWANYCRNKYRSFNVTTGTFRGYDGKNHFCVVK